VWGRAFLPVQAEQRSASPHVQHRGSPLEIAGCPTSRFFCEKWDSTVPSLLGFC
jgi:hypothetical protein